MKKALLLLGLTVLSGCSVWEELYNPGEDHARQEQDEVVLIETENAVVQSAAEPQRYSVAKKAPRPVFKAEPVGQKTMVVNAPVTDEMVIEIPAQRIYLSDDINSYQSEPFTPQAVQQIPQPRTPLSYSRPGQAASMPQPTKPSTPNVPVAAVTLQSATDPNAYAQCLASNLRCIRTYEQKGYRPVQGLPQFAGYQDVLSPSDYPAGGRWRHQNNIPRW